MRQIVNMALASLLAAGLAVAATAKPVPYTSLVHAGKAKAHAAKPHDAEPARAHVAAKPALPVATHQAPKPSPANAPLARTTPKPSPVAIAHPAPKPPPPPVRPPAPPPAHIPAPPSPPPTPAAAALPPAQPGARLAPGAPPPSAELEAFVDGAVREAMAQDHIAGVAVSVVQDGQVVLKKGYGFAGEGRSVDPDTTLFRLGEVSQAFTWIALMKAAEAGRVRLDTAVNLYLPEKLQVRDQGFKRPLLVRDLMNHTSGFADRSLGQAFEQSPSRVRPLETYLREERPRRVREAGAMPIYSSYDAALAGEAVAWADGHPFADVMEASVLRPLQMSSTSFREPYPARADLPAPMSEALARQVSTGYRWTHGDFHSEPFEYASHAAPASGGSSSAGDMGRLMAAILNGGSLDGASLYGPSSANAFQTAAAQAAPGLPGIDDGFLEFPLPGGYVGQGEDGGTLWFRASMITVPKLGLGVFVAANTDTGGRLVRNLAPRIVERFYAQPSQDERPGSPDLANDASVYDGTYLTLRRPAGGLEQFMALLTGEARVRVSAQGRLIVADRDGVSAWVPGAGPGQFVRADGPGASAFALDAGRAVRWYAPSGVSAYERIGVLRDVRTLALLAFIAAVAAIATLAGPLGRDRREFRETPSQARGSQIQTATAALWMLALGLFALFEWRAADPGYLMYAWPTPYLLIASACALVATLLSLVTLAVTPSVWRGGRRVDSWTGWRKARFSMTALIFVGFSALLGLWGALEPWSG